MRFSLWVLSLSLVLSNSNVLAKKKLSGTVKVDGSSTVFPISEAVAEDFSKIHPRVRVTVGESGTGGGFKKFVLSETDINNASREIKEIEIKKAKKNNIDYIKFPVAYDGISVVINKANNWAENISISELKKVWNTGSNVEYWSQINSKWPKSKIVLYGPGTDSGTFDYFTKKINGKEKASRSNYTKSENDNVIVKGVAGDKGAMGYFGYAYYAENKNKLKVLGIYKNNVKNAVKPSLKSINDGSYTPLSRPVFIYVNKKSLLKPHVLAFVRYYIKNTARLSAEVGYIALSDAIRKENEEMLNKALKELNI